MKPMTYRVLVDNGPSEIHVKYCLENGETRIRVFSDFDIPHLWARGYKEDGK